MVLGAEEVLFVLSIFRLHFVVGVGYLVSDPSSPLFPIRSRSVEMGAGRG